MGKKMFVALLSFFMMLPQGMTVHAEDDLPGFTGTGESVPAESEEASGPQEFDQFTQVNRGDTVKLDLPFEPEGEVAWSADSEIVGLADDGIIEAVSSGFVSVTGTDKAGNKVTYHVMINYDNESEEPAMEEEDSEVTEPCSVPENCTEIVIDQEYNAELDEYNSSAWFSFTPAETGWYSFESKVIQNSVNANLYESAGTEMNYLKDCYAGFLGETLALKKKLTAGTTYYYYLYTYCDQGTSVVLPVRIHQFEPNLPTSVSFKKDHYYMSGNGTYSFYVPDNIVTEPKDADLDYTISSGDTNIIQINGEWIYGYNKGTATVKVETADGPSAEAEFTVGNYAGYISAKGSHDVTLSPGETAKLEYELTGGDGDYSDEKVTFSSEYIDNGCITFDEDGTIHAKAYGYANIRATIANGNNTWFNIAVKKKPESLSFKSEQNCIGVNGWGTNIYNYLNCEPFEARDYPLTIESSNEEILSASGNYLYGYSKGEVDIKVTADNGVTAAAKFVVGNYAAYINNDSHYNNYLKVGEKLQLTYGLSPEGGDFSDEIVTWEIDPSYTDPSVSVSDTGVVTGLKPGWTTIIARIRNGEYTNYYVSVTEEPDSLAFTEQTNYVTSNYYYDIWEYLSAYPNTAYHYPVTITSDNEDVIKAEEGRIQTLNTGKATITVTTDNGLKTSSEFYVGKYAPEIHIEGRGTVSLLKGEETQLKYGFYPEAGDFSDEEVTWHITSNPDKAISIDQDGRVTAHHSGYASVVALTKTGKQAHWSVYVIEKPEKISFSSDTYYVSSEEYVGISVTTDRNSQNVDYVWTVSEPGIVSISGSYGSTVSLQYISDGTVTLRAESPYDSNVYAECKLVSYTPVTPTSISVESKATGYVNYGMRIPVMLGPVTASRNIEASVNNDTVTVTNTFRDNVYITCNKTGTAELTVTVPGTDLSAKTQITVVEGKPDLNINFSMAKYRKFGYRLYAADEFVSNPEQYTCLLNNQYAVNISEYFTDYYWAGSAPSAAGVNGLLKAFIDTGLFEAGTYGGGAASGDSGYSFGTSVRAVKAGTATIEAIPGVKIKLNVVDYAQKDNTVNADSSVDQSLVNSISNSDLGIADELETVAGEIEIPSNLKVNSDEKIVVQTGTSIKVSDFSKSGQTVSVTMDIEPEYQLVAVKQNADSSSEGRALTEKKPLHIDEAVLMTIPTGSLFDGMDIDKVYINHIKDNGAVYIYEGTYKDGYVTFTNPNGFSKFIISNSTEGFEEPKEPDNIIRLAGADRFDTSIKIAEAFMQEKKIAKLDSVILANGINFADALAGSYLSYVKNAPILITWEGMGEYKPYNQINAFIKANVKEGGTIYVLGGEEAVKPQTLTGLEKFKINRLAGDNRFETNLKILEETKVSDQDILVATGMNFADSLSASAVNRPILLVWDQLFDMQKDYLKTLKGNDYYILGGELAVTPGVEKQLKAYGKVTRLAGSDRHDTSVLIAETFCPDAESAVLALSTNFPDGLCGGPLASATNAPLILTIDVAKEPAVKHCGKHNIRKGYVLGGDTLVGDKAVKAIFNTDAEIIVK